MYVKSKMQQKQPIKPNQNKNLENTESSTKILILDQSKISLVFLT